jgi:3-isopropylmalate/(R)-2-methylmalate dehydratase small subunit
MTETLKGKAWIFGDDINTDYIISSKRKRDTLDPKILSQYLMEDIRPGFGLLVQEGDFLVGGKNFGCGSAMEIATVVIIGAGIQAVLAKSFSRTFFRNSINGGLLLVETDTEKISEGDLLSVRMEKDVLIVKNHTKNEDYSGRGIPPFLNSMVQHGGLIEYLREKRDFPE